MKRAVTIGVMLCLLLVSVVPMTQADGPVVITPYYYQNGDVIDVASNDEVIIRAGWGACTKGLAQAFTRAAVVSMEVSYEDDVYLIVYPPSQEFWSRPEPVEGDTSVCVMHTNNRWRTEWLYSLGTLEPGDYVLHFTWTVSHPIPDGGDYDGDGIPDLATPENFHPERTIIIHVQ